MSCLLEHHQIFQTFHALHAHFARRQATMLIYIKSIFAFQEVNFDCCTLIFYETLLYKKLVLNFSANYNRNTTDYCSHNKENKSEIKKLSVKRLRVRLDLSSLQKIKCMLGCPVDLANKNDQALNTYVRQTTLANVTRPLERNERIVLHCQE